VAVIYSTGVCDGRKSCGARYLGTKERSPECLAWVKLIALQKVIYKMSPDEKSFVTNARINRQ